MNQHIDIRPGNPIEQNGSRIHDRGGARAEAGVIGHSRHFPARQIEVVFIRSLSNGVQYESRRFEEKSFDRDRPREQGVITDDPKGGCDIMRRC